MSLGIIHPRKLSSASHTICQTNIIEYNEEINTIFIVMIYRYMGLMWEMWLDRGASCNFKQLLVLSFDYAKGEKDNNTTMRLALIVSCTCSCNSHALSWTRWLKPRFEFAEIIHEASHVLMLSDIVWKIYLHADKFDCSWTLLLYLENIFFSHNISHDL